MISKGFIKSSLIYTIAGALPMASAIILLPFYIQYLPTDVYGALSLYLAFALFVQLLVVYSFDTSLYIHFHEYKDDPKKLSSFISSAFIFMILIGVVVGAVLTILGDLLFDIIFDNPAVSFYPFGLMSVVTGIFQALCRVYNSIMQSSGKPDLFLRSNLFFFGLVAGFTLLGLHFFPQTLIGPIGGRLIAGFILSIWVLYRIFSEYGVHFNYPLLKSTFSYNHFTFISQVENWALTYFDRFLMLFFLSLSSVGVYDFAIKCLIVIEYIMNGFNSSFFPKLVSTVMAQPAGEKGSTVETNRYYHGVTAITMLMISLGILVLPIILDFFSNAQGYEVAVQYFPYIAVIYVLRAIRMYFIAPYTILKYTQPLIGISLAVFVIKFGLMVLLIRNYEIYGVVAASLVAAGAEILLLKRAIQDKFEFKFNTFKLIVSPLVLLMAVLLIEPWLGVTYPLTVHLFYVVLVCAFLVWVYRNELKLLKLSKLFSK